MENDDTVADTAGASAGTAVRGGISRYRIDGVLGRGGMGEVVSAYDDQIGRSVAVKRMRGAEPSPEATARFLREARIQGRLEHPAIVPVHELSQDEGAPFFVMKQLSGVTLADVIEKLADRDADTVREFPRQRLLRAFAEVCLAIEFAHTRDIVHRDLKPANIVLGGFGEVYVLDWGVARVAGEQRAAFADVASLGDTDTLEGAILGTPGYMSPEQIEGSAEVDARADVFALGCILFEILALEPLFPRGREGLAAVLAGIDARPSHRTPGRDLPPELDDACVKATAPLADRLVTARAVGEAVERFLDGDRDLAARAELARQALADARAHLETDPDDEAGDAMRAAGRAIALDPHLAEAAQLVGRLMLVPPRHIPPEVHDSLATADDNSQLETRKMMALSGVVYLLSLPLAYWAGFRDLAQLGVIVALALSMIVIGRVVTPHHLPALAWVAIGIHVVMLGTIARVSTPFLVAPALAVTSAMVLATQPRFPRWLVAAAFSLPITLAVGAEAIGLVSVTTAVHDDAVVLHTGNTLDPTGTVVALLAFSVLSVVIGVVMTRQMTDQRRSALVGMALQAWKLRQLIPQ